MSARVYTWMSFSEEEALHERLIEDLRWVNTFGAHYGLDNSGPARLRVQVDDAGMPAWMDGRCAHHDLEIQPDGRFTVTGRWTDNCQPILPTAQTATVHVGEEG